MIAAGSVVGAGASASPMPDASSHAPLAVTAVTLSVPAAPIPVNAAGRITLVYELHVANAGATPLRFARLEVHAESATDSTPIAAYSAREIERNVKLLAPRGAPTPKALTPGVRAIVYVWLTFDSSATIPNAISHRVIFANGDSARGGTVRVRPATNLVLASPVDTGDWWIGLGPSNESEHRRAVIRVGEDTVPHLAQRFAIDWVKMDSRGEYARDHRGRRNADWFGYAEPVLAVADARVAAVVDSIPDNTPGENSRAVAMTVGTVLGNYVILDLGAQNGAMHRYALYGHLKPGSVGVRIGDTVSRGQVLGAIGNSGNSDGPHLHFHVTEAPDAATAPLRGEGVPFTIDTFVVTAHDPDRVAKRAMLTGLGPHRNALPVEGDVIRILPSKRP